MQTSFVYKFKKQLIKPGLYIVSTPIGNLEDITFRAIKVLKSSEIVLCEDTRVSSNLLKKYNIKSKLISNHKFNEKKNLNKIIHDLQNNNIISIISDAGTPVISDPGRLLVNECIKNKIAVFPIPGASAVSAAISISGFNDKYIFCGFLPSSENEVKNQLEHLSKLDYSIVFFIPSRKINKTIKYLKYFFNDRNILIAKEMTKFYEEYIRSKISSLESFKKEIKGELTVVISGKKNIKNNLNELSESVKREIKEMQKRYSIKDIVSFFSKRENISKKKIYNYCLKEKK